ncbi:hypothetical protein SAMN05421831_10360 [Allopseudospirillum japonicum]|uniref:Exonuclease n=1 Tax=Allopseudospirillum japonicum TaxID=64971 RepID=A0A1H6R3G2_9GAMM|nr:hypothetical protein [Allopseudospirillum japonicum]SEI50438.1 hypothetical protein SAMN05421831_10360 [Allopseudospirillum japonicum]
MTDSSPSTTLPYIIDVEASGFGRGSYPIEIGIARPDGSLAAWLIRPEPDWQHWDPSAQEIHGISRNQLVQEGLPVAQVADALNEELRGQTVYSDSWGFDSSWIALLFYHAHRLQGFKIDALTKLLSEQQTQAWGQMKHQVIQELKITRHRASSDAHMLQHTFKRAAHVRNQV